MRRARIAVVGGGLSGLTAALHLHRSGLDVVVLEARTRVGGRAWRVELEDALAWDAGCQVLDDAHLSLLALAADVGVPVYRADPWGFTGMHWRVGKRASSSSPPLDRNELELFTGLAAAISDLEGRIDPAHPEDVEGAASLDRQTLGGWLRERGAGDHLMAVAECWYSVSSSSVPIDEMSLLAYAAKHAAGSGGPMDLRLEGGPGTLAARIAERLESRVVTGATVQSVAQESARVTIACAGGRTEIVDRAIIAVPLTVQDRIRFDPPLPRARAIGLERARYGNVVKTVLTAAGPLPRTAGLTETGYFAPHDERDDAVIAFCASRPARDLARRPPEERESAIATAAKTALGHTGLTSRHSVAWSNEPFSRGSYVIFGPGDLLDWGRKLPEPLGLVHFAGAEASDLPSYMEGAVRAGLRAAEEILATVR